MGILKERKRNNSIDQMDYIFSQSNHINKFLLKNTKLKRNQLISSGHLFYNDWSVLSPKKNKIKKIGIALTNEFSLRRYNDNNYLKNLYDLNNKMNLTETHWRLKQINFDQFYFCLIFDLIKKLSKKYIINIRTHVVDSESDFSFLKNRNIDIGNKYSSKEWIRQQDLIISTTSFINIDSYIYGIPHISLSKMIPKEFYFNLYKSFSYKDFPEPNSAKPKNQNQLISLIKNIKFKKNKNLDYNLKKYFSFPYQKKPMEIITNKIKKILLRKDNKKFDYILTEKEVKLSKIFGLKLTIIISYLFSQIKLYKNQKKGNNYYDFMFLFK